MIIERKTRINIPNLKEQGDVFLNLFQNFENDNHSDSLLKLAEIMQVYSAAMKSVSTKLEIFDDEFQITHKHSPIHHVECRVKGAVSIYGKLKRYGFALSLDAAQKHINDIAGIRVVCNFLDDIYAMEDLLLKQPDITLVERKDYIVKPKANGYRSLHLIVKTPVFLSDRSEEIPVEIQMRTIAMDYWASLEHMLRYKNYENGDMKKYSAMLLECANTLADTEKTMQYIREQIEE